MRDDLPNNLNNIIDILVRHCREQRQGDRAVRIVLRIWKHSPTKTPSLLVVRLKMNSSKMNTHAYILSLDCVHHDVAIAYAETSLIGDSKWSYPEESWDDASAAGYVTQSGDSVLVTHTFVVPDKVRIEGLRVVAVHETSTSEDNGPSTLGAVSVFLGEQENSAGTGLLIPLSFILALSTLAITTRSRR